MSGFKLLGIRAFEGTPKSILKAIEINTLYSLYPYTKFLNVEGESVQTDESVENIILDNNVPSDLFSDKSPSISVSAIVGKNGEGKSSLNELFYFFNFLVASSREVGFIMDVDELTSSYFPVMDNTFVLMDFYEEIFKSKIEVFYLSEGDFYRLYYDGNISKFKLTANLIWEAEAISKEYEEKTEDESDSEKYSKPEGISDFGYTIAINYSIYGLNGNGDYWLNSLFHKNDGYQTPIVINPYRNGGQIDVSSELHLSQTRTLSNLASLNDEFPEVIGDKELKSIDLLIVPEEFDYVWSFSMFNLLIWHKWEYGTSLFELFNQLSNAFLGKNLLTKKDIAELEKIGKAFDPESLVEKFDPALYIKSPNDDFNNDKSIKYFLVKYAVRKVFKICISQKEYKEKFVMDRNKYEDPPKFLLTNLPVLIKKLVDDQSHITIKLRQAIWAVKENIVFSGWQTTTNPKNPNHVAFQANVSFKEYKQAINRTLHKNKVLKGDRTLEAVPNAMYQPIMKVGFKESKPSRYKYLSSGEQQFINSFQTVIYHLRNLDSVKSGKENRKLQYRNVTIIFDEIELYFHPEFQRSFLNYLIEQIRKVELVNIKGIQIVFSTHSPFILSDVPKQNILQLENGLPSKNKLVETFGANIHTILSQGLFLKSQIGELAKIKIQEVISELNDLRELKFKTSESDEFRQDFPPLRKERLAKRIDLIGDILVRSKLREMYLEIYEDKVFLDAEIDNLESQLSMLKERKKRSQK